MAHITCCVNRSGNPRAGLVRCILEVFIGSIPVGDMLESIGIDDDG